MVRERLIILSTVNITELKEFEHVIYSENGMGLTFCASLCRYSLLVDDLYA